jgi:pentatricopeptide repeat protein
MGPGRVGDRSHSRIRFAPDSSRSLTETEDGYVEVTGFTPKASTLVRYAVKVGDRVLAVDSNLGDRMWPVSTVEGVISAVTSRLPGQQITFRFERSDANLRATAESEASAQPSVLGMTTLTIDPVGVALPEAAAKLNTDEQLLERCRQVMKRYTTDEKYINKFALAGVVADKVVYALASAETRVDPVTLSMIQRAYLSCRQPEMAIRVFEAAVGLRGDGSNEAIVVDAASTGEENPLLGKDDRRLVQNPKALDVYTASALMKAHALVGDLSAVQRVLAALEGRSDTVVGGRPVAAWPGTGAEGSLRPDTRCYNMVISAAADSGTDDGMALALEIFHKLENPTTTSNGMIASSSVASQKDIVSYNTIIKALSNNGRFQEAIATFYQMKKAGLKPDKFSYTSLVKAVMVDGDVEELLYEMREEGVVPDAMTFNTIIRYLCEHKKIAAARRIVNIMDISGVAPDSWTYGYLMKGLMDSGKPSAALTLFETACSDRRTVAATENVHLYTTGVSAAAAVGDHTRALELLSRMKTLGIKPNFKTLTALLGACLAAGEPGLAVDVFRRIPHPDAYAVTQGMVAMAQAGHCDEVLTMLSDRKSVPGRLRGKPLMKVYSTLLQASVDAGDYDMARKVANSLFRGGNIPSKALYQTTIEKMGLLPASGLVSRVTFSSDGRMLADSSVDETYNEKFRFLLFLLDSVSGRNLPCDAILYSAILSFGQHLGGRPKKISTLLVSAKAASGVFANKKKLIDEELSENSLKLSAGWEDLFDRYDDLKNQIDNPPLLPFLAVRISSSELPQVLRMEKNLSHTSQSRNVKM